MPNHRLRFEITCPSCGRSGVIRVTEDAGPPFEDVPRRTYAAEAHEFIVGPGKTPTIQCVGCAATFPGPF